VPTECLARDFDLATFDLEGTCVDLEAFHFLAHEHTLRDKGVDCFTTEQISELPGAIGGGDEHIIRLLAERFGFNPPGFLEMKTAFFEQIIADNPLAPRVGLVETIEEIRRRGLQLAIGSITPRARGELILERSGLRSLFPSEHIFFKENVCEIKPSPEVYLTAARFAGVHPSKQIVFEDSATGVRAAKAAGSQAIAVPVPMFQSHAHKQKLRDAGADHIFTSWSDVDLEVIL
jgi:beta-phosphoglucomutase-like phosphatase (HAD superfamily)